MSRNGSGTYSLASGNPVVTGSTISSTWANNTLSDIATALTASIAKDGQTQPTADLPMNGFKHTGVDDAIARDQYLSLGQFQDSTGVWGGTAGGTADALTISPSIPIGAYATGQKFDFIAASANTTTTPTLAVSGLSAKSIKDAAGNTLTIGAIQAGIVSVHYDGTSFRLDTIQNGLRVAGAVQWALDSSSRLLNVTNAQPAFSYHLSANQTSGNTILFDTADFTQQGGTNYATGTGLFTAPVAGLYQFSFSVWQQSSAGSAQLIIGWKINGSSVSRGQQTVSVGSVSFITMTNTIIIRLAANDTIGVERSDAAWSATRYAAANNTMFCGYLIG